MLRCAKKPAGLRRVSPCTGLPELISRALRFGLTSRMLPNHEYPIPQREPLIGKVRNRRIHRSKSDRNARRRRNHPSDMLIRLVPHLDPEGEVAWDVVEIWIGQLPKQFIHSEVRLGACAPKALRRIAQLFKHAQRV